MSTNEKNLRVRIVVESRLVCGCDSLSIREIHGRNPEVIYFAGKCPCGVTEAKGFGRKDY